MNIIRFMTLGLLAYTSIQSLTAASKHQENTLYPSFKGLVMAGYQGWFRTPEDGGGQSWTHWGHRGKFDAEHNTIEFWPDVTEYEKTYETSFRYQDGSPAKVFSSLDESTTQLHFKWMQDYGIDGVFMQRFFGVARAHKNPNKPSDKILKNALKYATKNERAIAVMYDLSGLRPQGEDCTAIMEDWKMLVDKMKLTSQGEKQTYLYHNGKPLVAIWGVGFPDRPWDNRKIGLDRLIDFLKNDPVYGGCSVLLGVPTYFRELDKDCLPDPYLHELIRSVDVVLPWMVQRFTPLVHVPKETYRDHIKHDLAWTKEQGVDYVPVACPGFSWVNLSKTEKNFQRYTTYGAIPRLGGRFFWDQLTGAMEAGAEMIYVAMFDEVDEGTCIIPISDTPPETSIGRFVANDGVAPDHYLWLTGQAGKMLRKEIPLEAKMPTR